MAVHEATVKPNLHKLPASSSCHTYYSSTQDRQMRVCSANRLLPPNLLPPPSPRGVMPPTERLAACLRLLLWQLLQEEHEQPPPLLHTGVEEGLVANLTGVTHILHTHIWKGQSQQ